MNLILVSRKHGRARTVSFSGPWLFVVLGVFLAALVSIFLLGYLVALDREGELRRQNYISQWQSDLTRQTEDIETLREKSEDQLNRLAIRMAELHARLIRLDAIGEQLLQTANIESDEFDFYSNPALGGPDGDSQALNYQPPRFMDELQALVDGIEVRERELEVLNTLLGNKDFDSDRYISGRPVKWGWLTSHFGRRTDPFTGKYAWHEGVDYAGKMNSDVIAVAAGVVTWSGERSGYGNMIEINHGGAFATRYGHANKLLVEVGDVVEKGQTIALMGSSGRSTGPHVHFEVLKNGNPINPLRYIKRKSK